MQCSVTSQHCLTATYSCELMLNCGRLCFNVQHATQYSALFVHGLVIKLKFAMLCSNDSFWIFSPSSKLGMFREFSISMYEGPMF